MLRLLLSTVAGNNAAATLLSNIHPLASSRGALSIRRSAQRTTTVPRSRYPCGQRVTASRPHVLFQETVDEFDGRCSRTETGVGGSPESLIPEPDGVGCRVEIQICCDTDPEVALENTCFWAPLWLMAEHRTNISDSFHGGR
jgi:hypothetical protein